MISNVPDAEELRQLAIRSYFVAWKEATGVFEHIEELGMMAFEVRDGSLVAIASDAYSLSREDSERNLVEYERIMQTKLQLVYSLIQHSQELALKSLVCERSPFLLLLGTDIRSWTGRDADFRDLKTIDASDLVKVVDAICDLRIEESFKTVIEQVRRGRNAIQHLGQHKDRIALLEPVNILARQYVELFPGRNWLKDFLASEGTALDDLFQYDEFTSKTLVLRQLSELHRLTSRRTTKAVLGIQEGSSVYDCPECISDARYDHGGEDLGSVERRRGEMSATCRLCDTRFTLRRRRCGHCGCDVALTETGACAGCGREPDSTRT